MLLVLRLANRTTNKPKSKAEVVFIIMRNSKTQIVRIVSNFVKPFQWLLYHESYSYKLTRQKIYLLCILMVRYNRNCPHYMFMLCNRK